MEFILRSGGVIEFGGVSKALSRKKIFLEKLLPQKLLFVCLTSSPTFPKWPPQVRVLENA